MAKTFDRSLTWVNIDPATLSPEMQKAYEAYKAAYRAMKEQRDLFERMMNAQAPVGKVMKFGYNFGKLSVALDIAPVAAAPKASTGVQSLSAWLASQAEGGHTV